LDVNVSVNPLEADGLGADDGVGAADGSALPVGEDAAVGDAVSNGDAGALKVGVGLGGGAVAEEQAAATAKKDMAKSALSERMSSPRMRGLGAVT
jgi:hypothetical protein